MSDNNKKLSKEPYKGVRDFYPEDKVLQNYIFQKWTKVCRSFGYEEMNASILEPTELYESKTGEEIINEQTYTFTDRGERRVTLRPEMTPTVARMIAFKKRDLTFPVRWYSIANFFRYERPQRGRSREFFQLNSDLFGASGVNADLEILKLAYSLMKEIGAEDKNFEIRINNRKFITFLLKDYFSLNEKLTAKMLKLIDKKSKISNSEFKEQAKLLLREKMEKFLEIMEVRDLNNLQEFSDNEGIREMQSIFKKLKKSGIENYVYAPDLMRGLDYYTGLVFEIWDTGRENNRSLFGGGRYDNLLEIFGEEPLPAIGFAVSDVVMENYLETYKLTPEYVSSNDLFICTLDESFIEKAGELADELRNEGLNVVVNLSSKKVGDQISSADKKNIPFITCIGESEVNSKKYKVKSLKSGEERELNKEEIGKFIKEINKRVS
jgi:histidyl-tRNA synthetase